MLPEHIIIHAPCALVALKTDKVFMLAGTSRSIAAKASAMKVDTMLFEGLRRQAFGKRIRHILCACTLLELQNFVVHYVVQKPHAHVDVAASVCARRVF